MKFKLTFFINLALVSLIALIYFNQLSFKKQQKPWESKQIIEKKIKKIDKNSLCKEVPDELIGPFDIEEPSEEFNAFHNDHQNYSVKIDFFDTIKSGGSWEPRDCKPRHHVAIIIPYKDRLENLNTWLFNMHPLLQRQQIAYKIFVVEQQNDQIFNKGILMNAAFIVIFKNLNESFGCLFFHDVDLLPDGKLA
jgi:hypothetical protein